MGRAYVRWAVAHPDYYQVMFGAELDKSDKPELLAAGVPSATYLTSSFDARQANLLPAGDPREIAGPTWSLLHGIASLTIGRRLSHVGIRENPQALAERSLRALLFGASG